MSRKSKGECTCKIVAQNERGMLGQVRDSVYRGVKYYGEDGQVEKRFCFPRKLAEEKWLEWLDADLTEDELRILEPLNRKQRRVAKRANEHNAKLKAELEEERNVEGRPKNMDAQADKQHGTENEKLDEKECKKIPDEYDIVKSVATVLYDMAINGMPYEGEFSQAFQNETGFELALKEGSQTKKNGKMMDKRSVEFDGKEYGMQMHVKGRNPKIGFRLYCEPDKERGRIVIGHCGHHLETAGTARRAVNK